MGGRVSIWFLVFVFALIASSISAEETESKEHVLTLDHSNFHDVVGKNDFIVVEFYAPWYGWSIFLLLFWLFVILKSSFDRFSELSFAIWWWWLHILVYVSCVSNCVFSLWIGVLNWDLGSGIMLSCFCWLHHWRCPLILFS